MLDPNNNMGEKKISFRIHKALKLLRLTFRTKSCKNFVLNSLMNINAIGLNTGIILKLILRLGSFDLVPRIWMMTY
jgi:hypothetical protein